MAERARYPTYVRSVGDGGQLYLEEVSGGVELQRAVSRAGRVKDLGAGRRGGGGKAGRARCKIPTVAPVVAPVRWRRWDAAARRRSVVATTTATARLRVVYTHNAVAVASSEKNKPPSLPACCYLLLHLNMQHEPQGGGWRCLNLNPRVKDHPRDQAGR